VKYKYRVAVSISFNNFPQATHTFSLTHQVRNIKHSSTLTHATTSKHNHKYFVCRPAKPLLFFNNLTHQSTHTQLQSPLLQASETTSTSPTTLTGAPPHLQPVHPHQHPRHNGSLQEDQQLLLFLLGAGRCSEPSRRLSSHHSWHEAQGQPGRHYLRRPRQH
jgi:hypothetical protein